MVHIFVYQVPFEDELSSLSLDDNDDFYSVYGPRGGAPSRRAPSIAATSDLESSMCSGVSGATAASSTWYPSSDRASSTSKSAGHGIGNHKRSGGGGVIDPALLRGVSSGSEGMVIRARVSVVTFVLTHQTPSVPSSLPLVERLSRMADGYFEAIAGLNCASAVNDFAIELTNACAGVGGGDHLRFTLKPFSLSLSEKSTAKSNVVCRSVDVTMGSLDVVECLFEDKVLTNERHFHS